MDRRLDAAGAAFFALLGVVGIVASVNLDPTENLRDPLTARGMPLLVSLFILIIAAGIAVRQLVKLRTNQGRVGPSDGKADLPGYSSSFPRVLLIWLAALAYTVAMPVVGYMASSFVAVMLLLRLMQVTRWRMIVAVAAVYAIGTWAFFSMALNVNLPTIGPWG